jgi:hypothetical protein
MSRIEILPVEVDIIVAMDDKYLMVNAEETRAQHARAAFAKPKPKGK